MAHVTGSGVLDGSDRRDKIWGGSGDDIINAMGHNDDIWAGAGNDRITLGTGSDGLYFNTALNNHTNVDTIVDFSHESDRMYLDSSVFTGLKRTLTFLEDFRFKVVGYKTQTTGVDKSDRILYDKDDGNLYYDQDGRGTKYEPIKFAEVKDNTYLAADDFLIY